MTKFKIITWVPVIILLLVVVAFVSMSDIKL